MSYSNEYDPDTDFDRWYTDATGRAIVERVAVGDRVLELGCATGLMTATLVAAGAQVLGVDRSEEYLARAKARGLDGAEFLQADVVDLDLGRRFDHVVLANVVHEVDDPDRLFATAARHLAPGGRVHVSLQNPNSIHRLVGHEMGLIAELDEVSDRGRSFDTREIFDVDELVAMAERAGLELTDRAGVMLKPLPNDLMASLPDTVLEGFVRAARHLPDHAAMNYLVFRSADDD